MDKERRIIIICLLLAVICSSVFTEDWKATVVKNLDALVSSCIVLPCSFTYPANNLPSSKLRGIWHVKNHADNRLYHQDKTRISENFRGRTKLLGNLGDKNCTLEISEIKNHDNGPFCFRIELAEKDQPTKDMFSFVEDCVELKMLDVPPEPTLMHSQMATEGHAHTITCSVVHTCPSHAPKLTWSRGAADEVFESRREIYNGNWETLSVLTFIAQEKDDDKEFTCTATFNGQKTSSATVRLSVKRTVSYNHIIIPCAVGIGTAVIFAVFCILMGKKYKNRIAELQNQEGTVWNRLSRISRRRRT